MESEYTNHLVLALNTHTAAIVELTKAINDFRVSYEMLDIEFNQQDLPPHLKE